jgi:hypothetical protein
VAFRTSAGGLTKVVCPSPITSLRGLTKWSAPRRSPSLRGLTKVIRPPPITFGGGAAESGPSISDHLRRGVRRKWSKHLRSPSAGGRRKWSKPLRSPSAGGPPKVVQASPITFGGGVNKVRKLLLIHPFFEPVDPGAEVSQCNGDRSKLLAVANYFVFLRGRFFILFDHINRRWRWQYARCSLCIF